MGYFLCWEGRVVGGLRFRREVIGREVALSTDLLGPKRKMLGFRTDLAVGK